MRLNKIFSLTQPYPAKYFALWRVFFGIYLLIYSIRIFPYRAELFSPSGLVASPILNWTYGYVPEFIYALDASALLVAMASGAVCILLGVFRRTGAVITWGALFALFNMDTLVEDPALPFVGLLLLLLALVPLGEPYTLRYFFRNGRENSEWYMPGVVYWGAWGVVALSFTITGLNRLTNSVWIEGEALRLLLEQPIALPLGAALLALPLGALKALSWTPEIVYLLSFPSLFLPFTRFLAWGLWVFMFVFVLLTLDLTQVALGMLLYFAFLFDPGWRRFLP
jgi:hypothetical protein